MKAEKDSKTERDSPHEKKKEKGYYDDEKVHKPIFLKENMKSKQRLTSPFKVQNCLAKEIKLLISLYV